MIKLSQEQREMIKKLSRALDELPAAYDQLWLFVLPRSNAPLDGVRSNGLASAQAVLNVEVLDLTDERDKITADVYPADDLGNRKLGILPSLSAWVRYIDEEMIKQEIKFIPPYRFIACSGACLYVDRADVILPGDGVCTGKRMPHWETKSVGTECAWLGSHLGFIQDQTWLWKIEGHISEMWNDCIKIIGGEEKSNIICISCGWDCKTHSNGAWYECKGCKRMFSWVELRNMAESRKPLTIKECAERSKTSVRLLHEYIAQGKIKSLDIKRGAAKLYDPLAVMQVTVAERYRKSPAKG